MTILPHATRALIADFLASDGSRAARFVLLCILASLAEATGILLLVPIVGIASGQSVWPMLGDAPAWLLSATPSTRLLVAVALFVAVMMIRAAFAWARARNEASLALEYEHSLRARLLRRIVHAGWQRGAVVGESRLQSLLIGEAGRASFAASSFLALIAALILLALHGIVALLLSPILTLMAGMFIAVAIAAAWPLIRRSHASGEMIGRAIEASSDRSGELVASLKTALAEGRSSAFLSDWKRDDLELVTQQRMLMNQQAFGRVVTAFLGVLAAVLVTMVGHFWLGLAPATLLPLLVLFARVTGPLRTVLDAAETLFAFSPAFRELEPHLFFEADASDSPDATAPDSWTTLYFDHVVLAAGPGRSIGPMTFELRHGDFVGVSGPTGSGKTLLVDAFAGLIAPIHGKILADGVDVRLAGQTVWAKQIAYVGQDEAPFSGCFADMLGCDGGTHPAYLAAVLQATGVAELVNRFGGLHAVPGIGAKTLSGGERQRLAIARALLRRPKFLILDEATSALDVEAEARLFEGLRSLPGTLTIIAVSHREDTLRQMDRVVSISSMLCS